MLHRVTTHLYEVDVAWAFHQCPINLALLSVGLSGDVSRFFVVGFLEFPIEKLVKLIVLLKYIAQPCLVDLFLFWLLDSSGNGEKTKEVGNGPHSELGFQHNGKITAQGNETNQLLFWVVFIKRTKFIGHSHVVVIVVVVVVVD